MMHIVLATDDNFIQHCAVTIVSVVMNNPPDIHFYVLTEGISEVNKSRLTGLADNFNCKIEIILVDSAKLIDCPMPAASGLSHISIATYYRLFIPSLLPDNIDRVLYLDCDIVVRKNLTSLWEIPLENMAVGAVNHVVDWNVSATQRLNYPVEAGYFNAGVLLMNLKYWRTNDISGELFRFLAQKKDVIKFHEQDALNGLLYDKCLRISCRWNMMSGFFMKNLKSIHDILNGNIINDYAALKKEIATEIYDPAVVHFVSKPKPWDPGCYHPYKNEYYKYLSYTPWKDFQEPALLNFYMKNPDLIPGFLKKTLIKLKSKELYIRL